MSLPQENELALRFTGWSGRSQRLLKLLRLPAHLVLLWLLTLPAILPLAQPTLTHSADGLLHLYRVVALEQAVRQGVLFPRWLPDLAYGYGFPLFVFYAPLAYYLTLAFSLAGLGVINSFNASLGLALLLAGTGVYLLARDIFGGRAGLLAGVAYVYAPFQLLNSLARGSLPAAWAMAAFPFVFWSLRRLIKQPDTGWSDLRLGVSLSALMVAAALLMHNTLSLLFVPLLGLFLGVELGMVLVGGRLKPGLQGDFMDGRLKSALHTSSLECRLQSALQPVGGVGLALLLGGGLAAFFLLPAILEQQFAQVERVIISPDFDFRHHFVAFGELFALPQPANTGLLNPPSPPTLGVGQVILAAVGLASLAYRAWKGSASELAGVITFTVLALLGTIFMMLPFSAPLWEQVPGLAFIQFPHRWLGPAALILALLAGALVAGVPERASLGVTVGGILLIFITTIPFLYPRYYDSLPDEPGVADMIAYEHASGAIGTTSFGEYLPVWVKQVPQESPLEPLYQAGAPVERLDHSYLPAGASVDKAWYGFNEAEMVITSPQPHQAVFHTFYFPGWRVEIDGEAGEITPVTERGLIGASLPAGQRRLRLYFEETPVRTGANWLSVGAACIILGLLGWGLKRRLKRPAGEEEVSAVILSASACFSARQVTLLLSLAVGLVALKLLYLDRVDNPWRHSFDGKRVAAAGTLQQVNFGDQANLLGYDLASAQVQPGQAFEWTLYWQARQPLSINYSSLAQLVDDQAHLYAGQDNLHPGSLPASQWQPWGFVQDPHAVRVPFGTPPGDYFLATGLYQPQSWQRLPVVAGGEGGRPDVVAVPVRVTPAEQAPSLEQLAITWPAGADFGPVLRLLGASPEREILPPNDFWRVALFWEARKAPAVNYQVSLRLSGPGGEVLLSETSQPSHNRYPTSLWQAGERVRDNHALWIPADFPAGNYQVEVQALDEGGKILGGWVMVGEVGR